MFTTSFFIREDYKNCVSILGCDCPEPLKSTSTKAVNLSYGTYCADGSTEEMFRWMSFNAAHSTLIRNKDVEFPSKELRNFVIRIQSVCVPIYRDSNYFGNKNKGPKGKCTMQETRTDLNGQLENTKLTDHEQPLLKK